METLHPMWFIITASGVALLPTIVGLLTSYVKISIVLGMVRSALGTQQTPSGLVVMALSLALTALTMAPTIEETAQIAGRLNIPQVMKQPSAESLQALLPLANPWKEFLVRHAGKREIAFLQAMEQRQGDHPKDGSQQAHNQQSADIELGIDADTQAAPVRILIPAFVLTELKEAFAMAFVLLLPFLVVDLIVANILVGMGMFMVSPTMISLPLKLILFVIADGWLLLAKGLIQSYQVLP